MDFRRTPKQLRDNASLFWPSDISEKEALVSVIPLLIKTQDSFLSILGVEIANIERLFSIIEASEMPSNLFLKHLMVLSDVGGEMLSRISSNMETLFPGGKFTYEFNGKTMNYEFSELTRGVNLSNKLLHVDGKELFNKQSLNGLVKDVIAILLFGSTSSNDEISRTLSKCEIGNLIGQPELIKKFVKERYIVVSRITVGAQSNSLGQFAQDFVKEEIDNHFKSVKELKVTKNGKIPGIVQFENDGREKPTSFDVLVEYKQRYVAIEVSFQVTTNSVIERKAGQARSRFNQMHESNHSIAYVIDGAGNFDRSSALETICTYSDCTVAFSKREIEFLCEYLKYFFNLVN